MAESNTVEILIKFGLDRTQAEAAVGELQKLKESTISTHEQGGNAAEKHGGKISGLNKALKNLVGGFGDLGRIAFFAARHPLLGFLGAATIGMHHLRAATDEVKKVFVELSQEAATPLSKLGEIIRANTLDAISSNQAFKESQEQAKVAIENNIKVLENEHTVTMKLLAARKALELSAATSPSAREAIESKYAGLEAGASRKSAREILKARQSELNNLVAANLEQKRIKEQTIGGLSGDQAKALLEDLEKNVLPEAQKAGPRAQLRLDAVNEQMLNPVKAAALVSQFGTLQGLHDYRQGLKDTVAGAPGWVNQLLAEQEALRRGIAADDAMRSLRPQIASQKTDVSNARTAFHSDIVAGLVGTGHTGAETMFLAGGGASRIAKGGKPSSGEAAAIQEAVRAFNLQGMTQQQIVNLLSQIVENEESLQKAIKNYESRLAKSINVP